MPTTKLPLVTCSTCLYAQHSCLGKGKSTSKRGYQLSWLQPGSLIQAETLVEVGSKLQIIFCFWPEALIFVQASLNPIYDKY